jgi:hypothetical protein
MSGGGGRLTREVEPGSKPLLDVRRLVNGFPS